MNTPVRLATAAAIIAIGMILSAGIISKFFVKIRHEQTITVKGSAEKHLVSGIGKFSCTYSVRGSSLKDAYDSLERTRKEVEAYLQKRGFSGEGVSVEPIRTRKINKRDDQGREINVVEFFDLSQSIEVTSKNCELVRDVAQTMTELLKDGIDIYASSPEFFLADVNEMKLELLQAATQEGHRRAQTLAENAKGKVGSLISAKQGVFQITRRNSTDISGDGMYDTSTIEKTAKVVVTLEYAVESK